MLQRVQKHCVSFFKLYTSKIPWSNHQLINVLVVSDWGKTLRYLSPKAFSPPALTLLQQTPPASVPSEVLWFIPIALIFLEKCSPLAMTFTADHQQLRNSPHTLRLQKSPSRASPDWHAFFLAHHMNTAGFWLSPELFCSEGPSYSSDIPKKIGHLKRCDLNLRLLAVVLNPLAKYMWVCLYTYICRHTYLKKKKKKKDNKVMNTVIAWAYLAPN